MRRFVVGADRGQSALFPEALEDWIGEDNPVRVIDVFVDELDLAELGFSGIEPEVTAINASPPHSFWAPAAFCWRGHSHLEPRPDAAARGRPAGPRGGRNNRN